MRIYPTLNNSLVSNNGAVGNFKVLGAKNKAKFTKVSLQFTDLKRKHPTTTIFYVDI